MSRDYRYW